MKLIVRFIFGVLFTIAGVLHFIREPNFTKIIPNYIPFKKQVTYISGVMEIVMGIYLIVKRPSTIAKKMMNLFLLAVLPANVYMARNNVPLGDKKLPKPVLYGRLPLQFILMRIIKWL